MFSITSAVLLGLISEKPMNPYELLRYINLMGIRRWFPISDSTVYTNVRTLAKNGLIKGEQVRENKMPPKTMYSITAKGQKELALNLEELIAGRHIDYISFNLGIVFMNAIGIEKTKKMLNKRLAILREHSEEMVVQQEQLTSNNVSKTVLMAQHRNTLLIETEIKVAKDYLALISEADFKPTRLTADLDYVTRLKEQTFGTRV